VAGWEPARNGGEGEGGSHIVIRLHVASRRLFVAERIEECGFTALDTLRIEAGHVLFSNELALEVTPYELGLGWLIDYRLPVGSRPPYSRRQPSAGMTALAARQSD